MTELIYKADNLSPDDPRDYQAETIFPSDYYTPDVYDNRKSMLPVRDQGAQGSCVAQSCACMKEFNEKISINFEDYMSPQWVYNHRANQDGEGMYPRDSMKILYKYGILPEEDYKYGLRQTPADISQELRNSALKYKIKGYAYVNTIKTLKVAILKNGACGFTVPVYHNGKEMWKPASLLQTVQGGHSMTAVGWTKEGFILRNSWGKDFGDNGYTIFPYSDWGMQAEIWAVIDDESTKPDPRYSKWYWKLCRGTKNVVKALGSKTLIALATFAISIYVAVDNIVLVFIPIGLVIGFCVWIYLTKSYLVKD